MGHPVGLNCVSEPIAIVHLSAYYPSVPGGLGKGEGDLHLLVGHHRQVVARLLLDLLAVRVGPEKGHGALEVHLGYKTQSLPTLIGMAMA